MIRARCRQHLRALHQRFAALSQYEVSDTPGRDYAHRIIVPKEVWVTALSELGAEQEWSNFKDEVAAFQGGAGREYVRALHEVWARIARLQVTERQERRDGVVRNTEGVIMNAEALAAEELANQKVLCPECGQKVFAVWPEGWDGHAGWACTIDGATPEERKANYKRRFRRLFPIDQRTRVASRASRKAARRSGVPVSGIFQSSDVCLVRGVRHAIAVVTAKHFGNGVFMRGAVGPDAG